MKLTVTITGVDQEELATTLEHEVLRYVQKGCQCGFDSNDTGSYHFSIDGWDDGSLPDLEDDSQPSDLQEHSDFAQDDLPDYDSIGECW